jgi:hypothetical protein
MALIRVPYPAEPERRRELFEKVAAILVRHGTYEGTPDEGSFRGMTPVGGFAGRYRSPEGSTVLEIELTNKPWIVPTSLVEHEVRKFLERV